MSYLRPTCSDAVVRVTNLNISRYMPSFRQGDTQSDHHVNTTARVTYEDLECLQRLPSQRPLDRRWDESRGLVFAEHSHVLKNHTWTPRRGILFAGSSDQRRHYATRPSKVGPTGVSKPAGQVFGSGGLPSLEKPPTSAVTTAPKGAKQEQMEREIRDKEAKIAELKQDRDRQISAREAKIAELQMRKQELEAKYRNMQTKSEELKRLFEQEKSKMYNNGRRDAEKEATEKAARTFESKIRELKAQRMDLGRQLEDAQAKLPTLKESMAREITRREKTLADKTKEFESEIANRYEALNKFDDLVKQNAKETKQAATETAQKLDEVSRELQLKEDGMLKRKTQRGDYGAYRAHYLQIHDERKTLDDRLRLVQKQLKAEIDRSATTTGEVSSQPGSGQDLKGLEKDVADARKKLADIDEETRTAGHASRLLTINTRFRDPSIAAESMSAGLYMTSINPLKSIKSLTNTEVDEISAQMQNASNSTLREELKARKDALSAQLVTLNVATSFAYLDREIQVLRTLKGENYANKALYMATIDLRTDLEEASIRARENRKSMTDPSHGEWRLHRSALDKLEVLAKKQAQILEVAGQHEEHEQRLDAMIDGKIAALLEAMQVKRESLFGSHKAARIASKRAGPARAPLTSTPSPSPLIRKTNRMSSRQPDMSASKQYNDDCLLKKKLVAELRDPAATMDAQARMEKVEQGLLVEIRTLEYQIELLESKLMARSRTRSDVTLRNRHQAALTTLRNSYARAKKNLEVGHDPWLKLSKSGSVFDASSKRPDYDATIETGSADRYQMGLELRRLKTSKRDKNLDAQQIASLDQQIQSLTIKLSEFHLQALRAAREALVPERDANKTRIEQLTVDIDQAQQSIQLTAAGFVTRYQRQKLTRRERMSDRPRRVTYKPSPDSGRLYPATRHLNLTPTSTKQAAHVLHMGPHFTDDFPWSMALREHQLPGGTVQHRRFFQSMAQGQPSFGHTAAFFDDGKNAIHAHDSGDVAALLQEEHVVANDISDTNASGEAVSDDDHAKSHVQPALASLSSPTSRHPSTNNKPASTSNMAESEEETLLAYEIPVKDKRNALIASRNSTASFWKYSMYKNAAGDAPTRYYCTTFEQTEAQLAKFAGEKVVGFDLEWERWHSKPGEDSAKRCVSLVQIASEDKVALFHLALFRGGDSAAALMPPALRSFLENPGIIKVGVNIGGDASRLKRCFGVEMQGNIELSHLYKLVTYGETNPAKVNRGLYALANQVKEVLHLPLAKGEVRTSSWSKRLNNTQTEYAASDAYAGLRLFYELERRRKAMKSKPPRPAFHELGLPIMLGDGQTAPGKPRQVEQPLEATGEPLDNSAALQEQEQEQDQEDDSDDFFDTPEDLEALDAYLESQDALAGAAASPSLPEISYPTLPPLEDSLSEPSSPNSSLPSDPLTKPTHKPKTSTSKSAATTTPPTTPTFPSPEAATAESWSTTWQSALPATHDVRVSKQALRAYHVWHHQNFSLQETAALLRKEPPLALSTVVTYIAEVLQKEGLEFDEARVREIRARLPVNIRGRYGRLYAGAAGDDGESESSSQG